MSKESKKADIAIKNMTYETAIQELDKVLFEIKNGQVNMDELILKVEKSKQLIQHCQQMLRDTKKRLEEL